MRAYFINGEKVRTAAFFGQLKASVKASNDGKMDERDYRRAIRHLNQGESVSFPISQMSFAISK